LKNRFTVDILVVLILAVYSMIPFVQAQTVPPGYSVSVFATGFSSPKFLEFGPGGAFGTDLYVSDMSAGKVYKVDSSGAVTTFATGIPSASGLAFSTGGAFGTYLYVGSAASVYQVDTMGTVSLFSSGTGVGSIEFGPGGAYGTDLYVAEWTAGTVSTVDSTGTRTLFASVGDQPRYLTFDRHGFYGGYLYVSLFTSGDILRVDSTGVSTTFATISPNIEGPQFAPSGIGFGTSFYHGNLLTGEIFEIFTDGSWNTWGSGFVGAADIAFATAPPFGPAMYVADGGAKGYIYKIVPIEMPVPEFSFSFPVMMSAVVALYLFLRRRIIKE